ncbi:MFS transporter [Phytohabitans rumicis]|uniref:MFS transporter n=1 Tax=Phytohabitans rumicis TaxID=1076125 RepID=A0A6V8KSM2_9ACTN|nr:MFS transporter [Phytohabitans rumicis]GFJ86420.1 MFS transporter [Phytohabitans rumicis]
MLSTVLPARREARWILVGTLLSAVGRGLTLPFLYIYLTEVRGLAGGTAGLAVGWMGAVGLALSLVGGTLIDRFGARRVLLPSWALLIAGSVCLALVQSAWQAFAVLTVFGVGNAAVWSGQSTVLATLTSEGERQRTFGLHFTMINLGIGVGGLISGVLVDVARPSTFQLIYLLDAASYLVPATILLAMPAVGGRIARPAPAAAHQIRGGYAQVLRHRPFRRLIVFALVLTTCGYAQIEVGFPAFATVAAQVSPRVVGWALAANAFTIVVAQLFVLRAIDGRSRTRILAVVCVIFACAWLVLGGAGLVADDNTLLASAGVIGCAWIFSLGETLLSPVMPALTNALATDELRGRYNAMNSVVFGLSGIIGPISAGPLIGAGRGDVWVLLVVGGCLVASVLALSTRRLLTPAQDGRTPPQHPAVPEPSAV